MVAMFEWLDLVEKAVSDRNEGLDLTKSVYIWKALAHTRWRQKLRESYISAQEKKRKNKYYMQDHKKGEHNINSNSWYEEFNKPKTLK